jgi:predicted RNase H-like nuclease (RuvC/YqgF family)
MGQKCYRHNRWSSECPCGLPLSADRKIEELNQEIKELTNALNKCKTQFGEIDYHFDYGEDHEQMCRDGKTIVTKTLTTIEDRKQEELKFYGE